MGQMDKLKAFIAKSKRVWLILKKPTRKEYEMIAKVSAIGIAALGVVGFLISIFMNVFG
jgi:protein transport protein SEC61 subunit gamma-like protein